MEIGKSYKNQLKSPSMRSVHESANKNQYLMDAQQDITKSKTTAGIIKDETYKVEALTDTLAGGFVALEHKQNEEEDKTERDESLAKLRDAGFDVEITTTTFADTIQNKDLKFGDRGTKILVNGEEWSTPKVLAYGKYLGVYDNENNFFNNIESHYGPKFPKGAGKFNYSEFSDEEMVKKIVMQEHKGLGFANLKNITDTEWDQLFNDGYIEREVEAADGIAYKKQYKYSKKSTNKNVISDKNSPNYIFDGTWDHGILMVNSAWTNTTSGITLDPSHDDYKNDSSSLEFGADGVTKDVLFQGVAKVGQKHYGKDKWNNASNQQKQTWLQNNTKMNYEMGRYLAKEGGIGGISDRGGWNQWSTMPAVARHENLKRSKGTLKETEGAFFGDNRGFDKGDFYGKNSMWRSIMNSWKKGG